MKPLALYEDADPVYLQMFSMSSLGNPTDIPVIF